MIMQADKPKMRKDRLKKMADFLETQVKSKWFNLRIVASRGFSNRECGSAACVMGWTPAVFPNSGAELFDDNSGDDHPYDFRYNGKSDFEAAELFYGLDEKQTHWLCNPYKYTEHSRGRMSVVRRLRYLVKHGDMPESDRDRPIYSIFCGRVFGHPAPARRRPATTT